MSDTENKKPLTGPHEAGIEDDEEKQKEDEVEMAELNAAIDVSQDLVSWTRTPAGKDTVDRLQKEARKAMNELFSVLHEDPSLPKLISAVARFESAIQMTRRFTGAEEDLDILLNELSRRRPGV